MAFLKSANPDKASESSHKITIERMLDPQPPKGADHNWYDIGMLAFYDDKKTIIWKQEIKEAIILDEKGKSVFKCSVEFKEGLGWKLKSILSNEDAKFLHPIILNKIEIKYQL